MSKSIGLVVGIGTALVGSYMAYQSTQEQTRIESELNTALETRGAVQHVSGESEGEGVFAVGTAVASFVNSRSIMRGATIPWNGERLLDGKFRLYREIGGEGVRLNTRSGDRLFGMYFSVSNFHDKIREMGGRFEVLDIHLDHPFFKVAENITLQNNRVNRDYPAVRIPYSADLEDLFRSPKEFLDFCRKMNIEVLWEDNLQPFEAASWYHWNSRKQNLVLTTRFDMAEVRRGSVEDITIENRTHKRSVSSFFETNSLKSRAIVFDGNIAEVKQLFSEGDEDVRGLKIEQSSWKMAEYNGKVYFLDNGAAENLLLQAEMKGVKLCPFFRVEETPVNLNHVGKQGGAVILSMNQTNSFSSYSHEILTFLFNGVNVLAYDNAGKGISQGKNSERGMTEAVRSAGDFLISEKDFEESQILFKGQCAGGLPTSEAGRIFPTSHIWVDQAPRTFYGAAQSMALVKSEDIRDRSRTNESYLGRAAHAISSSVPFLAPTIGYVSSFVLPSYDVVENLQQNRGKHIYTIGVPDARGFGGDQLVPTSHRDAIREQLQTEENGVYLEMPGATHVTDWWKDPNVLESVKGVLSETHLSVDSYAVHMAGGRAVIEQRYEAIFGEPYDDARASDLQYNVHEMITIAYEGEDMFALGSNLFDIRYDESPELHLAVLNACLDAAQAGGQKDAQKFLVNYKRENT